MKEGIDITSPKNQGRGFIDFWLPAYSCLSATIGSTFVARRAGM